MGLFGNKSTRERKSAGKSDGDADSPGDAVTHRFTLDLSRAHGLAAMIASSRASKLIEIPDLVAGMYMYEWERLSEYWPEENRDSVEDMLREICRISPQRWNSWIQLYDTKRRSEPESAWQKLKALRKGQPEEVSLGPSAGLRVLFQTAEQVSPFRDTADGHDVPVLTMECVLLCIAQSPGSEIGKKLRETGLDVAQLEKAALDPKRSPRR
jgi:hypothetical protein